VAQTSIGCSSSRHAFLAESVVDALRRDSPEWQVFPEVSFSIWGERGVIDLLAWHPGRRALLVIELKTELVDVGELHGFNRTVCRFGEDEDVDDSHCSRVDEGEELLCHLAGEVAFAGGELDDDVVDRAELVQWCLCLCHCTLLFSLL